MSHSEQQPVINQSEQELHTPELYDYRNVLEALRETDIPDDDIAYIGGVVVHWDQSIPSWENVKDIRRAKSELDMWSDRTLEAKGLLEKAEQLLIAEHWDMALEAQREANRILRERPGLFYLDDIESGQRFMIETLLLTSIHSNPSELHVTGQGNTVRSKPGTHRVRIDAIKLTPSERIPLNTYLSELEIPPIQ